MSNLDALGVPKWVQPSSEVHRFWWRGTNYERMPNGDWKATLDVLGCPDEARATAEREAAADPAQAARLRAIDRLTVQREKEPVHPLLAAFVARAKASLADTKEPSP